MNNDTKHEAQVQGWKMVKVNEAFSDLVNALERADRKGYLAEALIESWEAFDYEYADATAQPAPAGWQLVGYARKDELTPLLSEEPIDGKYICIGLDHPICWADEPPYEWLTPLYVVAAPKAEPQPSDDVAKVMADALKELLECPFNVDAATVPKAGIEAAPEQVVLEVSVALLRWRKARKALAAYHAAMGSKGE